MLGRTHANYYVPGLMLSAAHPKIVELWSLLRVVSSGSAAASRAALLLLLLAAPLEHPFPRARDLAIRGDHLPIGGDGLALPTGYGLWRRVLRGRRQRGLLFGLRALARRRRRDLARRLGRARSLAARHSASLVGQPLCVRTEAGDARAEFDAVDLHEGLLLDPPQLERAVRRGRSNQALAEPHDRLDARAMRVRVDAERRRALGTGEVPETQSLVLASRDEQRVAQIVEREHALAVRKCARDLVRCEVEHQHVVAAQHRAPCAGR
mmetsp:Transcript_27452/g.64416  ORF Transcript_27452/g.64416 Transcript_27452/m.64416 type:complete len:266 (-) Transcript_27452:560-1357(-)